MNFFQILNSYGIIGIMIAGFAEGTFLPVPMEFISIPIYLSNIDKVLLCLAALLIFSFIGTVLGYTIGKYLGDITHKFIKKEHLDKIGRLYEKNSTLTLLSSIFTPIPYETYTFSAGIFRINFKKFIIVSFISRVIRHSPQAFLIYFYGERVIDNMKIISLTVGITLFTFTLLYLFLKKRRAD